MIVSSEQRARSRVLLKVFDDGPGDGESVEGCCASADLVEEKALFNARVDPRTKAEIGSRLRLAIDPHRFHFFDPKTGKSLLAAEAAAEPEVVLTT